MLKTSAGPSLNVLISTGGVCSSIRSKKLFYQPDEDASDARRAGPFWCSRSQSISACACFTRATCTATFDLTFGSPFVGALLAAPARCTRIA